MLLEDNRVSNREREAQGELKGHETALRDAAQLVNLRFNSKICMLPRQQLNFVPCEARGWVVQRERSVDDVAISCPGNGIIGSICTLGFHSRVARAER